jgi:CheY-like chemotaxis protein
VYFMTEDEVSEGLDQTTVLGRKYEAVEEPAKVEAVLARVDLGEGTRLWKYARAYRRSLIGRSRGGLAAGRARASTSSTTSRPTRTRPTTWPTGGTVRHPMTARTKVLVVDDHDVNRLLAQDTLDGRGLRGRAGANGAEALARFAEEPADCVLLDVRMPDIDGFAVCERLRALPGGAETPVLFLTALRDIETFDRASRTDADDFLTKPVRPRSWSRACARRSSCGGCGPSCASTTTCSRSSATT